jgi:hypothetical protein
MLEDGNVAAYFLLLKNKSDYFTDHVQYMYLPMSDTKLKVILINNAYANKMLADTKFRQSLRVSYTNFVYRSRL